MNRLPAITMRPLSRAVIVAFALSPSVASGALAGNEKGWNEVAGSWLEACGCKDENNCGCSLDIWGPDLSGRWSSDCKDAAKSISFDLDGEPARVVKSSSSCKLVTVTDYRAMDRYFFVRSKRDCDGEFSGSLIAEYRYDYAAHRLAASSDTGVVQLAQCDHREEN